MIFFSLRAFFFAFFAFFVFFGCTCRTMNSSLNLCFAFATLLSAVTASFFPSRNIFFAVLRGLCTFFAFFFFGVAFNLIFFLMWLKECRSFFAFFSLLFFTFLVRLRRPKPAPIRRR